MIYEYILFVPVIYWGGCILWVFISIIYKKIKERFKKTPNNKPDKKQDIVNQDIVNIENPYLKDYYEAIKNKDKEAAIDALCKNADSCSSRNSYCLEEVFCPECPLSNGGLNVKSSR